MSADVGKILIIFTGIVFVVGIFSIIMSMIYDSDTIETHKPVSNSHRKYRPSENIFVNTYEEYDVIINDQWSFVFPHPNGLVFLVVVSEIFKAYEFINLMVFYFLQGDFMKNFMIAIALVLGMFSYSYAGECDNCVTLKPRRSVTVTKNIVRETVRLPRRVVNSCTNGVCRSRSITVVR